MLFKYRVWVRTRDWVAPWNVPGAPGKFQILIDGKAIKETFGTKNAEWHWHDGGVIDVGTEAEVALHDLTGFEGRCEAILFCKDVDFEPTNDVEALTKFRRKLLGLPDEPDDGGEYDLLLDIYIDYVGYSAAKLGADYLPTLHIGARLVDAESHQVVYNALIQYQSFDDAEEGVSAIDPDPAYAFAGFDELMAEPEKARDGLRLAISDVVSRLIEEIDLH